MSRNMVLLTGGFLDSPSAKTAINLIRYQAEEVIAVLDLKHAGKTCQDVLGMGGSIPVVARLSDVAAADTLVIGIAPAGGKLPEPMRAVVLEGIQRNMNIVSGLHEFLACDSELAEAARHHGVLITDVRRNQERDVSHRRGIDERCLRILTVGQDCNVGKMVVSLELSRAMQAAGVDAKFVATGQTGMMIDGDGCPVDAVVADFINGAVERLILRHQHHSVLLIEGQGSLAHPRYSPVTLGLVHGSMPDGMILCYEMGRQKVHGMDSVSLPSLGELIVLYEAMARVMHPSRVLGVAMNSHKHSEDAAAQERERVRRQLGLPVCDVLRHGPDDLVRAVLDRKREVGK